MPLLLGTVASAVNTGGLIETVAWTSDFSEYAGTDQNFLPETGWAASNWNIGDATANTVWKTTNSGGNAYLHLTNASTHLHYDGLNENHEVEADVKVISPSCVAGVVLAVSAAEPLLYVGVELIKHTTSNGLVGYVRWEVAGTPTEEFFYHDITAGLVAGTTYTLRARILDNFVTIWLDGVVQTTYQLTTAQVPDITGHTRCGVIHYAFEATGSAQFDRVELRGLRWSGPQPAPLAPINLEGIPGETEVNLTWLPMSGGLTDYVIQYSLDDGSPSWSTFSDTVSTTAATTVTGLTAGTDYLFRVAAVNAYGTGAWSDTLALTTITIVTLPTTNLIIHLDASTLSYSNGDPVSTWDDQSPVGTNDGTQTGTARPTYIASGLNGLPTVRFDGTDDYLAFPSGFTTWTAGYTWFFVVKPISVGAYDRLLNFSAGGVGALVVGRNASGSDPIWVTYDSATALRYFIGSSGLFTNGVGVVISVHNPAGAANAAVTGQIRKGNADWGSGDTYVPHSVTRTTNWLGVSPFGSEYINADFSEVLVYNRALDETEIGSVYAYLDDKYGL